MDIIVWPDKKGQLWLRPSIWPPERPACAEVAEGSVLSWNGWWAVVKAPAVTAIGPAALPCGVDLPSLASLPPSSLLPPCRPSLEHTPLSLLEIQSLLSSSLMASADILAQRYWEDARIRELVRAAVLAGNDGTPLDVAAAARDHDLWPSVVAMAEAASRPQVIDYSLARWADMRGVEYFSKSLSAGSPAAAPNPGFAIRYFATLFDDQGRGALSRVLPNPRLIEGRPPRWSGQVAMVLNALEEQEPGFVAADWWLEYACADLFAHQFDADSHWVASRGVRLLIRHRDPRLPAVIHKLFKGRAYEEEYLLEALTLVEGPDSAYVTAAMQAATKRWPPSGVRTRLLEVFAAAAERHEGR